MAGHQGHSSLLAFFLVLLAATAFAASGPAKTQSPSDRTSTSSVVQLPAPKEHLNFVVGARGLDSLSFNGESLLVAAAKGELQPHKSGLRTVLDAVLPQSSAGVATPNKKPNTIDLTYPWGGVSCVYGKQDDRLTMRIEVSNTSSKPVSEFSLRIVELTFPRIPKGGPLEAGMFGFGFKGPERLLDQGPPSIPVVADPQFVVPMFMWITGPVH
jgi:hypothetical protein